MLKVDLMSDEDRQKAAAAAAQVNAEAEAANPKQHFWSGWFNGGSSDNISITQTGDPATQNAKPPFFSRERWGLGGNNSGNDDERSRVKIKKRKTNQHTVNLINPDDPTAPVTTQGAPKNVVIQPTQSAPQAQQTMAQAPVEPVPDPIITRTVTIVDPDHPLYDPANLSSTPLSKRLPDTIHTGMVTINGTPVEIGKYTREELDGINGLRSTQVERATGGMVKNDGVAMTEEQLQRSYAETIRSEAAAEANELAAEEARLAAAEARRLAEEARRRNSGVLGFARRTGRGYNNFARNNPKTGISLGVIEIFLGSKWIYDGVNKFRTPKGDREMDMFVPAEMQDIEKPTVMGKIWAGLEVLAGATLTVLGIHTARLGIKGPTTNTPPL